MRVLVTGKNGQVGACAARWSHPGWELVPVGREECDLASEQAVRELMRNVRPDVVVNAAAYTAVDQAEKERDRCFAINAAAPRILAEEAKTLGALLIHYSTDYVFNGEKNGPYSENDEIDPLNVYGASKAAGEKGVSEAGGRYLILRTTWVYASQGRNFLRTMLRLAAERPELRVVDDQIGAPTSAAAIAAATRRLIQQAVDHPSAFSSGLYHMTAGESTSWCGFARAIVEGSGLAVKPQVVAIATSDFPTPARRPQNSILSNDKFENTFGFRMSSWREQLKDVFADMRSAD
jgi:dTDP-4-dehydrorhamnose reductase